MPLVVYRRLEDGGREAVDGHPLARLLNELANPGMNSFELRELLLAGSHDLRQQPMLRSSVMVQVECRNSCIFQAEWLASRG